MAVVVERGVSWGTLIERERSGGSLGSEERSEKSNYCSATMSTVKYVGEMSDGLILQTLQLFSNTVGVKGFIKEMRGEIPAQGSRVLGFLGKHTSTHTTSSA